MVAVCQKRCAGLTARVDAHPADALGDEHAPVIGEGDVPRMVEAALDHLGVDRVERAEEQQDGDCRNGDGGDDGDGRREPFVGRYVEAAAERPRGRRQPPHRRKEAE